MNPPNLFVPEYIRTLSPYVPGKPIEETQREFNIRRVVKLASNENPLGPSPRAMAAVRKALPDAHRYPDGSGYRLKHALSEHLGVAPQSLILGNGSNEIIDSLVRVFCVAGDSVVTSQAAFVAFRICAQIHGVRTLEAPLTSELRFDLDTMLALVREDHRVRLVYIPNPNNPTGTYVDGAALRRFLKGVAGIRGGNVLVVLDYAYWEYVTAPDLPDPLQLQKEFPSVVVLRTFSKVYGLGGLRLGYGIAAPAIIADLEKVRMPFNVTSLGLVAGEAALGDRAFVARARKINAEGMKYWEGELKRLGIPFWPSQGNFVLVDVRRGLGRSGVEVYNACLRRGVIFRPVANYGLHDLMRISIGTPAENRVAVAALEALGAVSPINAIGAREASPRSAKPKTKGKPGAKAKPKFKPRAKSTARRSVS